MNPATKTWFRPRTGATLARNAQHGQNRTGVEVDANVSFDEFESSLPVDPAAADARLADEGEEIRARIHSRGNDVLAEAD
jgi:hypothetical protein